ncbi:MAG: ribosome silencing factor [Acidobacteriota bacterium]|nr:ribosome silencing factor [Acidobacteriota bacterium]MDH3530381.1 ribosome silencing factor [Acidobacteriota bacterium]
MEEVTKTKSLKRENITGTLEITGTKTRFSELDEDVKLAVACAEEKKAIETLVLDLRPITSFTEFFVIAGGTNQRHVQAIADEIVRQLKKQMKVKPIRIEGYAKADWILLDFGDFIVHVFNEKSRAFYDLERLWRDAKQVELPKDTEA